MQIFSHANILVEIVYEAFATREKQIFEFTLEDNLKRIRCGVLQ